jgi:serine/threonine-protein kinase RsbW
MERRTAVPADAAQLPALTQFLQDFWSVCGLPTAGLPAFELALEEVFINIVMHGSLPGTVPRVEVSLALNEGDLTMTLEDDGTGFDPLSLPTPDLEASADARPVGGLGVFLMRQMMDSVRYQRVGARNQLSMTRQVAR